MPHCARVGSNGAIYPDAWVPYPNCQPPGYVLFTATEAQAIQNFTQPVSLNDQPHLPDVLLGLTLLVATAWAFSFLATFIRGRRQ